MQVIDPTIKIKFKENLEDSNNGDITINKKTPAVTIVAAWIKAETGVGPSIASGSQVWSKNWADFPIAPIKRKTHINVIRFASKPKKIIFFSSNLLVAWKFYSKLIVPKKKKIKNIAIAKPKSPILLTINALIAALFAVSFLYQKPINR